ncbi:MAG: hypothetical protein OXK82_03530 [Deltaproteobacteria bacterium]|nr:hypothetical protein [Deltaproteobacteria bacterium]
MSVSAVASSLADGRIELLLRWRGGDHTRLSVRRNRTGQHRWSTDAEVGDLIRTLAKQRADGATRRSGEMTACAVTRHTRRLHGCLDRARPIGDGAGPSAGKLTFGE